VREQAEASSQELRAELRTAEKELARRERELVKVAAAPGGNGLHTDRMAGLQDQIQTTERRVTEICGELDILDAEAVSQQELKRVLEAFDPVWKALNTGEQTRIVRALVERVGYIETERVAVVKKVAMTGAERGFYDAVLDFVRATYLNEGKDSARLFGLMMPQRGATEFQPGWR
jgi:multidrug efflux pump subunit AcrA (membrane-fusion protein)